jgi:dihydroorotate dehydrogenase (NAD+) catalytic subunit
MPDLRVALGPLTLKNPVLVAAGTFGYGVEFARAVRLERLGGLITKTVTRKPREGNPPPRVVETPSGMLNAVGLQNIGLDAFLTEKLPALRPLDVPIIVSVLSETPEELAEMVQRIDQADGAAGIELNLSCPNLHHRGLLIGQDVEATFAMVQAARKATRKPVVAKLSPDVTDPAPVAQAAQRAGADALSVTNTFMAMSLDADTRRSRLGAITGGLSGPAIRPLAVYRVWRVAQAVQIPVIGLGGIVRAKDAVEFFLAGATAVAVGTATFADPRAALHVIQGLERYLVKHHLPSITALRGALVTTAA